MCGIVGYLGTENAREIIIKGLHRLEYRGYDSAGIALSGEANSVLHIFKDKGRVAHLEEISKVGFVSHQGIGHTRWATHGVPNQINSHPHDSEDGRFFIVHNGVIENYKELKNQYLDGRVFKSDTDTEVIAYLIEKFSEKLTVEEAIRKTMSLLEGSYALAIIDRMQKDKMYAAKNKSPLLIGLSDKGIIVGSDVMALVGYSKEYIPLQDHSFVKIDGLDVSVYDIIGKEMDYEVKIIDVDYLNIEKGEYAHFMLKEINEQPSVIRNIISRYFDGERVILNGDVKKAIAESDRLYIIAAGTSMNAGAIGRELFEKMANIPCEVHIASEFAYNMPLLSKKVRQQMLERCLSMLRQKDTAH